MFISSSSILLKARDSWQPAVIRHGKILNRVMPSTKRQSTPLGVSARLNTVCLWRLHGPLFKSEECHMVRLFRLLYKGRACIPTKIKTHLGNLKSVNYLPLTQNHNKSATMSANKAPVEKLPLAARKNCMSSPTWSLDYIG